jgi:carboxyl-terminal processing protease
MKRYALIVMALLSAAPLGTLALDMAPDAHQGRVARMLALNMPLRHLSRESLDDHISTNALEIFLGALDGERTYFLASDIADFQTVRQDLDDQLKAGDVAIAYKIYNVFKTRVANRVAYVKELLDQGFDLSQDETYAWKRKDAEWPKDEETWNDLWRRKIKHELVARMVAQKIGQEEGSVDEGKSDPATNSASAAEAKLPPEQQIRKSYDRFLTIMQDNDAGWLLERYLNGFTRAYDPSHRLHVARQPGRLLHRHVAFAARHRRPARQRRGGGPGGAPDSRRAGRARWPTAPGRQDHCGGPGR